MFYLTIADTPQIQEGFRFYSGRLVLGRELEFLRCSAGVWKPSDYRRQWKAAAASLACGPIARAAFVTSIARGKNNIGWWLAYRRGGQVTFRNQMLCLAQGSRRVVPELAHKYTPRIGAKRGLDSQRPSEWRLTYKEVLRWLRSA